MSKSFITNVKEGQAYSRLWPAEKTLHAVFPEPRVIAATQFAVQWMPPVSVAIIAVMYSMLGVQSLFQSIAMSLLVLSFPVQGYYWLGVRSSALLPPQTLLWYRDIHAKMLEKGCQLKAADKKPTYRSLAVLLSSAFSQLDASFRKDWF